MRRIPQDEWRALDPKGPRPRRRAAPAAEPLESRDLPSTMTAVEAPFRLRLAGHRSGGIGDTGAWIMVSGPTAEGDPVPRFRLPISPDSSRSSGDPQGISGLGIALILGRLEKIPPSSIPEAGPPPLTSQGASSGRSAWFKSLRTPLEAPDDGTDGVRLGHFPVPEGSDSLGSKAFLRDSTSYLPDPNDPAAQGRVAGLASRILENLDRLGFPKLRAFLIALAGSDADPDGLSDSDAPSSDPPPDEESPHESDRKASRSRRARRASAVMAFSDEFPSPSSNEPDAVSVAPPLERRALRSLFRGPRSRARLVAMSLISSAEHLSGDGSGRLLWDTSEPPGGRGTRGEGRLDLFAPLLDDLAMPVRGPSGEVPLTPRVEPLIVGSERVADTLPPMWSPLPSGCRSEACLDDVDVAVPSALVAGGALLIRTTWEGDRFRFRRQRSRPRDDRPPALDRGDPDRPR